MTVCVCIKRERRRHLEEPDAAFTHGGEHWMKIVRVRVVLVVLILLLRFAIPPDAIVVSEAGVAEGHEAIQARLGAGVQKGNTIAEIHPAKSESSGKLSYTEGSADIISGGQHLRRRYLVVVRTTGLRKEIIL